MINGKALAQQYHLQHQSMKKVITLRYNRAEQYDKQAGSRSLNA
jgi:ribosomal protein L21